MTVGDQAVKDIYRVYTPAAKYLCTIKGGIQRQLKCTAAREAAEQGITGIPSRLCKKQQ